MQERCGAAPKEGPSDDSCDSVSLEEVEVRLGQLGMEGQESASQDLHVA